MNRRDTRKELAYQVNRSFTVYALGCRTTGNALEKISVVARRLSTELKILADKMERKGLK